MKRPIFLHIFHLRMPQESYKQDTSVEEKTVPFKGIIKIIYDLES